MMDIIETKVDTKSDEYKKNYEAMEALVSDLKKELKKAREERPQKTIDRLAAQGKLMIRKKLDMLLDKNTPFLEIAPLAAKGMYDGNVHGAGNVVGIGVVEGREVIASGSDATIKGGAVYPMGVKKALRCQTIAMENHLPMISLLDSAGAYLPLQSEIFPDVDDGGRIFYNQAIVSKMGIPQITAVMGLCTAIALIKRGGSIEFDPKYAWGLSWMAMGIVYAILPDYCGLGGGTEPSRNAFANGNKARNGELGLCDMFAARYLATLLKDERWYDELNNRVIEMDSCKLDGGQCVVNELAKQKARYNMEHKERWF